MDNIGEILKNARLEKGLSLEQVEATFHACGYKKSLRNFFKSGSFNQNGGYLLSHCDAVPSA